MADRCRSLGTPCTRSVVAMQQSWMRVIPAVVRCAIEKGTATPRTEHAAALRLGASPQASYAGGVHGALCDQTARAELRRIGADFDWTAVDLPTETGPAPGD